MSYIFGKAKCKVCSNIISYYWLYPDCKANKFPDKSKYFLAHSNHYHDHYTVTLRCPYCHNLIEEQYIEQGKLIENESN